MCLTMSCTSGAGKNWGQTPFAESRPNLQACVLVTKQ